VENPGQAGERPLGSAATLTISLPLGTHHLALRVTDARGETGETPADLVVRDTVAPVVTCPAQTTAECAGPSGAVVPLQAVAQDACGAVTVSNDRTAGGADAGGTYPFGSATVHFTATDAAGLTATCASRVEVQDSEGPSLALHANPSMLWPPNHEMIPVGVTWDAIDLCGGAVTVVLTGVTSSEPDDAAGLGDGATTGDIGSVALGTPAASIPIRSERAGTGSGRTYELHYLATDAGGNTAPAVAVITVPRDETGGPEPLLIHVENPPGGSRLYWSAVPGALGYDVIRGSLDAIRVDGSQTTLGSVSVLARGMGGTSLVDSSGANPTMGHGFFYLIQQRTSYGGVGYGTESAPRPRVPSACGGGCP
jgi:HYR domain